MDLKLSSPAARLRVLITRAFRRLGFEDDSFLLILAVIVGVVTAAAAVAFHKLIVYIRDLLYAHVSAHTLYETPVGLLMLLFIPALGGLLLGLLSQYVLHAGEGHGIVDVMESVTRTSGFQKPTVAIEKILTSALTIGSGGSCGAEGPIVQIGAAIASAVGRTFRLARQHMPVLTGCGCAAGISAIFNAPFGGVLFTLEVILQDFSIRAFTPIVVSSVIAQVSTLGIFQFIQRYHPRGAGEEYSAIFAMVGHQAMGTQVLDWGQIVNFVLLGLLCGLCGLALTRSLYLTENVFHHLRMPRALKPALGGLLLGVTGVLYVLIFGRLLMHAPKPFDYQDYRLPAFYSDGYGVIQRLLRDDFVGFQVFQGRILLLLLCLCGVKIVTTCLTLSSGGSGGVIAPCLFLGATLGAALGMILKQSHAFVDIEPRVYALVGMGAVLAAVVHAPLASILIVFELTQDYRVMLPAMLACVMSTGIARVIFHDSVYTLSLRLRGVRVGGVADLSLLRRLSVEQVALEPAVPVRMNDPLQKLLDLTEAGNYEDFVVVDAKGTYLGMVVGEDIRVVLLQREAIPLLTCSDVTRTDLPLLENTTDLSAALTAFSQIEVSHLPVCVAGAPRHVIGLISRAAMLRRYQQGLADLR